MSFNGDFNSLMRLIFLEKNDVTFGVLVGLLLFVIVLMLIRSVVEEKSGGGGTAEIDSKSLGAAVEGAVKKALSEKTIVTEVVAVADSSAAAGAVASPAAAAAATVETTELKKTLNEREAKIAALMSDLEVMKAQVEAKAGAAPVAAAAGSADLQALHAKVSELQAKLSEYEIIEDDIADLSSFKEENKKLKDELEKLRATGAVAAPVAAPVAAAAAPAPEPAPVPAAAEPVDQVASSAASVDAFAAELAGHVEPVIAPKPAAPAAAEPFTLDTSDDVMGEFAAALSGGAPAAKEPDKTQDLVVSASGAAVENPQAAIDALLNSAAEPEATASESMDAFADVVATAPKAQPKIKAEPEVMSSASEAAAEFASAVADGGLEAASESVGEPAAEPAAVEPDPFGPLDTEKMLEEVASMKEEGGDGASVLEEQLDTDRLMAEMGMTDTPAAAEAAPSTDDPATEFAAAVAGKAPPVAQTMTTTMAPPAASTMAPPAISPSELKSNEVDPEAEVPVDDLLAEFKDTDFQLKKG